MQLLIEISGKYYGEINRKLIQQNYSNNIARCKLQYYHTLLYVKILFYIIFKSLDSVRNIIK